MLSLHFVVVRLLVNVDASCNSVIYFSRPLGPVEYIALYHAIENTANQNRLNVVVHSTVLHLTFPSCIARTSH